MDIDFVEPSTSKIRFKVIFPNSKKYITIKGFDYNVTLADALIVLDAAINELGADSYDIKSIKKISVWHVNSEIWVDIIFTASDISPIFSDSYQVQGNVFTATDILPIVNGSYSPAGNKFSAADIARIFQPDYQLSY